MTHHRRRHLDRRGEVTVRSIRRLPLPLLVVGAGLVVAGLHTGSATASAPDAGAVAYVPAPGAPAPGPVASAPPVAASPARLAQQVRVAPRHRRPAHASARVAPEPRTIHH